MNTAHIYTATYVGILSETVEHLSAVIKSAADKGITDVYGWGLWLIILCLCGWTLTGCDKISGFLILFIFQVNTTSLGLDKMS